MYKFDAIPGSLFVLKNVSKYIWYISDDVLLHTEREFSSHVEEKNIINTILLLNNTSKRSNGRRLKMLHKNKILIFNSESIKEFLNDWFSD